MAAVSGVLLDSGTGSGTTATTGSVTTNANRLQLLAVFSVPGGGNANDPTITDSHGLTWVEIATLPFNTSQRVTVFRALKSISTSGTRVIDFGGQSQAVTIWEWHQFANVKTTGANGAGAIVQVPTPTSGTSATASITLASFADATNNAAYGAIAINGAGTITADASGGYTIDQGTGGGIMAMGAEWKAGQDTTATGTFSSTQWGMIGLEIGHGSPPSGRWPYDRGGRTRRTRQLSH